MTPPSPGPVPGPPRPSVPSAGQPTATGGTAEVGTSRPDPDGSAPEGAARTDRLDEQLDENLEVLDTLAGRPLQDHVAVYGELHTRLQAALTEIDNA